MREIKFRAWDIRLKEFVDFWLGNLYESINDVFKDDHYVFMQYTNLKDKNGKEIYEGDVVKYTSGDIFQVQWMDKGRWNISMAPSIKYFTGEVIGNIYEHSELLK